MNKRHPPNPSARLFERSFNEVNLLDHTDGEFADASTEAGQVRMNSIDVVEREHGEIPYYDRSTLSYRKP